MSQHLTFLEFGVCFQQTKHRDILDIESTLHSRHFTRHHRTLGTKRRKEEKYMKDIFIIDADSKITRHICQLMISSGPGWRLQKMV